MACLVLVFLKLFLITVFENIKNGVWFYLFIVIVI